MSLIGTPGRRDGGKEGGNVSDSNRRTDRRLRCNVSEMTERRRRERQEEFVGGEGIQPASRLFVDVLLIGYLVSL